MLSGSTAATYRVDHVLCADGVRDQKPYKLDGTEASVTNTVEDGRDVVRRRRNEARRGRLGIIRAASKERDLRRSVAVRNAYGTGELDADKDSQFRSTAPITLKSTYKSPNETLCLIANGR